MSPCSDDATCSVLFVHAHVCKYEFLFTVGNPPQCNAWIGQCGLYILVMIIEKLLMTLLVLFDFWRDVSCVYDVLVVVTEKKCVMNVLTGSSETAYFYFGTRCLSWLKERGKEITSVDQNWFIGDIEFISGVCSYECFYFSCISGETIHHVSDQRPAS